MQAIQLQNLWFSANGLVELYLPVDWKWRGGDFGIVVMGGRLSSLLEDSTIRGSRRADHSSWFIMEECVHNGRSRRSSILGTSF